MQQVVNYTYSKVTHHIKEGHLRRAKAWSKVWWFFRNLT